VARKGECGRGNGEGDGDGDGWDDDYELRRYALTSPSTSSRVRASHKSFATGQELARLDWIRTIDDKVERSVAYGRTDVKYMHCIAERKRDLIKHAT